MIIDKLKYWILAGGLFVMLGCEDVVEVELEATENVVVVDAWVNTLPITQEIRLTESQAYFNNGNPTPIENATVVIKRNDGRTFDFLHEGQGFYRFNQTGEDSLGVPGDRFDLSVWIDDRNIIATTEAKRSPSVDSITVEYRENEAFLDDGYYCQFYARDYAGTGDAYWIKTYKNDEYLDDAAEINLAYDAGFDAGTGIDGLIFIPPIREAVNAVDEDGIPSPYAIGDKVRVEVHSLTNEAFNFMEIARDQIQNGSNGIFALPLANARTNFTSSTNTSVLGFFNVAVVRSREIIVEE